MNHQYDPSKGFALQDLDGIIAQMNKRRIPAQQPIVVGEFGMLMFDIEFAHPKAKFSISHWYLPKRAKKILAEGRIGRKESNLRLVVYRNAWTSSSGVVKFIGPAPENALVSYPAKHFRYELYDGTRLLLQTNDLKTLLNHSF